MQLAVFVALLGVLSFSLAFPRTVENRFVAETDVILNLYTRNNPTTSQVLKNGDVQNLTSSNFQLDKPLKVFTHGWAREAQFDSLVAAFLAVGDFNVIIVDWTAGTGGEEEGVVANAPLVGKFIASFLDWVSTLGLPFSQIHIVGHSLGSHVTGWAGRSCTLGQVDYVTGLDPSKRFWEDSPDKINPGDGKYVEIIHTSIEFNALYLPTGTADFYPNGGTNHPGCDNVDICNHIRSIDFFEDSLGHEGFVAQKCLGYEEIVGANCSNIDTTYMGGTGPAKTISGVYYLTTNAEKPYYQG